MPYSLRLKHLEESYNRLTEMIDSLEKGDMPDSIKLKQLYEKQIMLRQELRKLNKAQLDSIDYGDEESDG